MSRSIALTHAEATDVLYGLGNSHPDDIDLIHIGWKKDILMKTD